jgi:peptidoglycan/LPS O-acetylase OafA/YrhL
MRLRYLRRFYTRLMPLYVVVLVVAAVFGLPLWGWVVIGVGAAVWLQSLISLSLRIRAEERSSGHPDDA